jgi:N-acetylmuramoyl-L-alanine amidase
MEYKIVKPDIKFAGQLDSLNLNAVDGIALHHMAHPTWTVEEVHEFHRDIKGWLGVGYNYWIGFDGTIYLGRGLNQAAGIKGHNEHLLHIGFQGDYEEGRSIMPDEQFNAGVWLINHLKKIVPTIRTVHGHKHWAATKCPGIHFPLIEMITVKYRGKVTIDRTSEAIDLLVAEGVIEGPAYWHENARTGKEVRGEYASLLIQKMAKRLKGEC